jgi:hypothetical protein
MQLVVRAMRGPSWLAWLSLLFVAQLGTADAIAGSESDDLQDRAAVHAPVRSRPLPGVFAAASQREIGNHDELAATPGVLPVVAPQPLETRSGSVSGALPPLPRSTTSARPCLRAPPFSHSL